MTVTTELMVIGTVHDYGDQALLLEFDSTAEVLAWTDALREADLLGVLDIVPASRTVLIKLAGPRYQAPTRQRLGKLRVDRGGCRGDHRPDDGRADIDDRRGLRRRRPRRGGPADRHGPGAGRRRAHRHAVAGRIRRIRTGFRLPRRRRRTAQRAAAIRAADQGARRVGRAGRRVQRRLSAGVARRLAADRATPTPCCGTSTATSPRC